MNYIKYAKVSGDNVVVKLPIDVLEVAFNDNPNNYDDEIKVKYKRKFAQGFADLINDSYTSSESGLTIFQEWVDELFEQMIEGDSSYIKYPEEDD